MGIELGYCFCPGIRAPGESVKKLGIHRQALDRKFPIPFTRCVRKEVRAGRCGLISP